MKHLYAPWRMDYILGEKPTGCFFCDAAAADSDEWREHLIVHRGDAMLIMLNRYPYNGGHLMIAPLRHTRDYGALSTDELMELSQASRLCVSVLEKAMQPEGFNIGMNLGKCAGAGVDDHLHLHVVPRWTGDSNFMPVIGETRSIPVALEAVWEQLTPLFKELTDPHR